MSQLSAFALLFFSLPFVCMALLVPLITGVVTAALLPDNFLITQGEMLKCMRHAHHIKEAENLKLNFRFSVI